MAQLAWCRMEREARQHLRPLLHDYVLLARRAHGLLDDISATFQPTAGGTPLDQAGFVQVRLLVRISTDLRVLTHAAESGYSVQALSLLAGIYELSAAVAFIGSNEERARRWEEHQELKQSYPPASGRKSAVGELILAVSGDIPSEQLAKLVDEQERLYTIACIAKHGNPHVMRDLGVRLEGSTMRIFHGPFADARSIKQARFAVLHGARMLFAVTHLFAKARLSGVTQSRELVQRFGRVVEQLVTLTAKPVGHGLKAAKRTKPSST